MDNKTKLAILALQRLQHLKLVEDFDPMRPGSRPTKEQQRIINDMLDDRHKVFAVLGGNRCLAKGTLVATPSGAVPIECIKVGDTVFDENGSPIRVLKTFNNGLKVVADLVDANFRTPLLRCTADHQFAGSIHNPYFVVKAAECSTAQYVRVGCNQMLAVSWGTNPKEEETYDIHVDSDTNLYLLANGIVTHNSGKSAISRRILAWMLREDDEACWKRPDHWKGKLTFLMVGKSHKQLLGDFLPKFQPFFNEGDLHVVKQAGSTLFSITYRPNGNTIYCFVHENAEQCRERVQAFAAHAVFLDELPKGPSAMKLVEELQARTVDSKGYTIMSFTPKSVNPSIKKFVDNLKAPLGKKYNLAFLDNPGIDDEAKALRLAQISTQSAAYQKTLLEGDWMSEGNLVFHLPELALRQPEGYSASWRHVVAVDPGLSSATGVVLLTENPHTSQWYVIQAEKWEALKDVEILVNRLASEFSRVNVVRWVYDAASDWFAAPAYRRGLKPLVHSVDKNNRKDEMIANLQVGFGSQLFIAPWCDDLQDELATCTWSDRVEGKILNGNDFHLLDALRYGFDCVPKPERAVLAPDAEFAGNLRRAHYARLEKEAAKAKVESTARGGAIKNRGSLFRRHRVWGG